MNIKGFGNATGIMIQDFEENTGVELPEDYKHFLNKYNGGTSLIRYSTFFVEELKEEIPLDILYGLQVDEPFDLNKVNEEFEDELLSDSIIIGEDPGSGMVVLINGAELKGVYYWDSSYYFEKSTETENLYKIADSFNDFITMLKSPSDKN